MLKVENLTVEVAGKLVLKGLDLEVPQGEAHVLFGPNASGKTTLIKTILGFPNYRIVSGKIEFKGINITNMPVDERIRLGMGVAFQSPPMMRGVKVGDLLTRIKKPEVDEGEIVRTMNFDEEFVRRDLNLGFSGGELKRSEVLQVLVQQPDFAMFDEPDSGVDVENLEIVGKAINEFFRKRSGILITHLGYILRYVETDMAHVLLNGRIVCSGKPSIILGEILKEGYRWCETCPRRIG